MNNKNVIIILVIAMILLSGAAIYIGVRLSGVDTVPEESSAATVLPEGLTFTNFECSGDCGSGSSCDQFVKPPAGYMNGCWKDSSRGNKYYCGYGLTSSINDNPNCYCDVYGNYNKCGCDVNRCESECLDQFTGSETGRKTLTLDCDNCGQYFTCECSITPTPTITTTVTNTNTPTNTPTGTPSIPETALISDDVDRILIGIFIIFLGLAIFKTNTNLFLGNLFFKLSKKGLSNTIFKYDYYDGKFVKDREKFEKKINNNI